MRFISYIHSIKTSSYNMIERLYSSIHMYVYIILKEYLYYFESMYISLTILSIFLDIKILVCRMIHSLSKILNQERFNTKHIIYIVMHYIPNKPQCICSLIMITHNTPQEHKTSVIYGTHQHLAAGHIRHKITGYNPMDDDQLIESLLGKSI